MSGYLVTTDELTSAVVTLRLLANTLPAEDPEGLILRAAATIAPRVGFASFKADRLLAQRNAALEQRRDK